ncbi:MAG: VTT domain-containing protein [Candidatus Diapherotrites archaeon]|nr:VTT domain-containing protein [Candidatus Diapherotrites archaeon]
MLDWLVAQFGIIGFFIAAFVSNTLLPLPFELLVLALSGMNVNIPLWLVVAATGATLGESTVYALGLGGHELAERYYDAVHRFTNWIRKKLEMKRKRKKKLRNLAKHRHARPYVKLIRKWGFAAIYLGAVTPLPMFLFDIVAGYYKYDYKLFALACFLGKLTRYALVVSAGISIVSLF